MPKSLFYSPAELEQQLRKFRRTVDFDTFDIHTQQLTAMLESRQIKISPKYQRKFRWEKDRCSQFIESLLLGIPIPSIFMATNGDNSWEVVDGVQRLSTIIKFVGGSELRLRHEVGDALELTALEKLDQFNGLGFDDFPETLKLHFGTRPIKVITLNDKSDLIVRYDLFERLNTGGVLLSPQEIRDCIFEGMFADRLEEWSKEKLFRQVVRLTKLQERDATAEECVLRFFAFRDRYKTFDHSVVDFLNDYMRDSSKGFDYAQNDVIFKKTFLELARVFPEGIRRSGERNRDQTPLNLFEGISVGASLALDRVSRLDTTGLDTWLASPELRKYTTVATNDKTLVKHRIEFCRNRFLGKPYVSGTTT
jgi:Protein of unknown function DUF262